MQYAETCADIRARKQVRNSERQMHVNIVYQAHKPSFFFFPFDRTEHFLTIKSYSSIVSLNWQKIYSCHKLAVLISILPLLVLFPSFIYLLDPEGDLWWGFYSSVCFWERGFVFFSLKEAVMNPLKSLSSMESFSLD